MLKLTDQNIGGYERVVRATDDTTGLDACISIHNTQLGPAIGGCRYYSYKDFDDQRLDALRLSKQMTYKNALAGLHNGGAKTTINSRAGEKSADLWKAFAEALDKLGGIYYTAGDIGTTQEDLLELHKHTQYVLGYEGVDSGWATAYGVYQSISSAWKFKQGLTVDTSNYDIFVGRSIAIIGLGKVGSRLSHFLGTRNRDLTIYTTDLSKDTYYKVKEYLEKTINPSTPIRFQWCEDIEELNQLPVDIYAPCATGGMVTDDFAKVCKAKIICGGANNQLENDDVAQTLLDKGIMYVPDYLANSGGVVQVSSSYDISHDITTSLKVDWDHPLVKDKLKNIKQRVYDILSLSQAQKKPTNIVAKEIVENKLKDL